MLKKKRQLKTLRFGIEFEIFTLDEQGYMTNGADRLISRVKKEFPKIEIKKECGKNMIEITTLPHTMVPDAMLLALDDFEKVAAVAKKEKMILYAYGTYPGTFTPEFHNDQRYQIQQKIIGKQRYAIAGRCIGLHFHFSLPWGVFDDLNKIIKPLVNSKNMQSMINFYNLCIAIDPALTTFSQSSPFYQSQRLGKDARVIAYRGGKALNYPDGLHANLQNLGALQRYKSTNTDIHHVILDRFNSLKELFKKFGFSLSSFIRHRSILDSSWNPIKINSHGTMEIRGADMNHPDVIIALAVLLKFITKEVQEKYLEIVPSDAAIEKPFHFDGKKILIPPDSYVINKLQPLAAYEGLSNPEIYKYCEALLQLGRKFIPKDRIPLLIPIETFLKKKETASDRIISEAQKITPNIQKLSAQEAAKLALQLSEDLYNEIRITKKRLESLYKNKVLKRSLAIEEVSNNDIRAKIPIKQETKTTI